MTPTFYIPVGGTHSWLPGRDTGEWYHRDSRWAELMKGEDFLPIECDGRPFTWSTQLDGLLFWRKGATWAAAGHALFAWVVPPLAPAMRVPPAHTNVISHSHGLQVVLHACALGMKVNTLTDIAGPVRGDMRAIAELARPNIRFWQHIHSDRSDRMQWLGGIGDGAFGIVRAHPLADRNVRIANAGHSGMLTDLQWFGEWPPLLDNIRAASPSEAA